MPEMDIPVDNCGGQNNNNEMILFLNMIKEGGLFGTATLNFYIKGHTKNWCDHTFNSLKVLYQKQNVFTFENLCGILNTIKNAEVIQIFHERFFDLVSLLDYIYDRPYPKIFNVNHVFQVKNESARIGYCQDFHGEAYSEHDYNKYNTYSNAQIKRLIINIFKDLNQI